MMFGGRSPSSFSPEGTDARGTRDSPDPRAPAVGQNSPTERPGSRPIVLATFPRSAPDTTKPPLVAGGFANRGATGRQGLRDARATAASDDPFRILGATRRVIAMAISRSRRLSRRGQSRVIAFASAGAPAAL